MSAAWGWVETRIVRQRGGRVETRIARQRGGRVETRIARQRGGKGLRLVSAGEELRPG